MKESDIKSYVQFETFVECIKECTTNAKRWPGKIPKPKATVGKLYVLGHKSGKRIYVTDTHGTRIDLEYRDFDKYFRKLDRKVMVDYITTDGLYSLNRDIDNVIEYLASLKNPKYRQMYINVEADVEHGYYDEMNAKINMQIHAYRLETDEEKERREEQEKEFRRQQNEALKEAKRMKKAQEKAMFEKLKKKYATRKMVTE